MQECERETHSPSVLDANKKLIVSFRLCKERVGLTCHESKGLTIVAIQGKTVYNSKQG